MSSFSDDIKAEFRKPNNVVVQLIIVNIGVWLLISTFKILGLFGLQEVAKIGISQFLLPSDIEEFLFKPWTLISYFFSHEKIFHILMNLLGIWWFGRILQDLIGSNRVLGTYMLSGIAGGVLYLIMALIPAENFNINGVLLGASGSVFGLVVAVATLAPTYRTNLLLLGSVEMKWVALGYVILSYVSLTGSNAGGNVAHLGGAFMGYVFIKQLQAGRDLARPIVDLIYAIPNLFKKKSKLKVSHKSTRKTTTESSSNINQAQIDQILDKISASGYSSLSKDEKEKLFKYSNKKN